MNAKKIISYSLLGVIAALILVVIILSFVTKKYSPTVEGMTSENPTKQISVSKYENGKEYAYKMIVDDFDVNTEEKGDYQSVINVFNSLGSFSIMQGLFLGLNGASQKINHASTVSFSDLHKMTDGYLVEFSWNDSQTLKDVDGTEYKDANGDSVKFTKIAIFVDDSNNVGTYKIYIKTYSFDSTSVFYTYTTYSNVKSLYDLAKSFDDSKKLQKAF